MNCKSCGAQKERGDKFNQKRQLCRRCYQSWWSQNCGKKYADVIKVPDLTDEQIREAWMTDLY